MDSEAVALRVTAPIFIFHKFVVTLQIKQGPPYGRINYLWQT